MRLYWTIARSLLTIMVRDRGALIGTLLIPIVLMVALGTLNSGGTADAVTVAAWLMAGVMVQSVMSSSLDGDMAWLTGMRDRGILWRIRATPLPPSVLVLAYISARLVLVLAQMALITVVAVLIFRVRIEIGTLVPALGILVLGSVVFLLLGQALAAVAPTASAASLYGNLFFFPLIFMSNLFIIGLPENIERFARWSPAYMLVDLLRPALVGATANQAAWINTGGLVGYGLFGMIVTARFFGWEPKR